MFFQQDRGSGVGERPGVVPLMIGCRVRIRNEDGRDSRAGEFGERRPSGARHREIGLLIQLLGVFKERSDCRIDVVVRVGLAGRGLAFLSGLMEDTPTMQRRSMVDHEGVHEFVDRSSALAAAQDEQSSLGFRGGRSATGQFGDRSSDRVAGELRTRASRKVVNRLLEGETGHRRESAQEAGRAAGNHVLFKEDDRNPSATGRQDGSHAGESATPDDQGWRLLTHQTD